MSDGFAVDTATLERFRATAQRLQGRVGDLRGELDAAALAPGTFTRTAGGQRADAGHAEMLDGMRATLDAANRELHAIAEAAAKTVENYEDTDARHATAMSDIEGRLDYARGYQP